MSRPPRKHTGTDNPIPKKMLTPKEVAERLGMTEEALAMRRLRRQGPPHVHISKRCPRYPSDAYDSWAEALKPR